MLTMLQAEQFIIKRNLRRDTIALLILPREVTHSNRVDEVLLVAIKLVPCIQTHQIVVVGRFHIITTISIRYSILIVHTHIRHDNLCCTQETFIVLIIVRIGQREV